MSVQATGPAGFVPPMPPPRPRTPGPIAAIRMLREDILSFFPESSYRGQVMPMRLLSHRLLVVNQPDMLREVFILRHEIYQRKSSMMERALEPVLGDGHFINHGPVWAERRAVVSQLLHPSGIDRFHPLFVQAAEELAASWQDAAGGPPRDIAADLAAATGRVVTRAVFGPGVPAEAAEEVARSFAAYQEAVEHLDIMHLIGMPEWLPSFRRRTARVAAARLRELAADLIATTPPGEGLLGGLAAARREDGTPVMAGQALLNEVIVLLLAGSETSANALSWALYLASCHAPTLDRLRAELDRVLGPRAAPGPEELTALPFTRAVMQEAMRLYPPVGALTRSALKADRIRRFEVTPGMTVACIPWLLHRNPTLWDAPHEFRPERFMPGEGAKRHPFAYVPFGLGPRVCAGAAFGLAEMTVFLAILARRLDLAIAPGHRVAPRLRLTVRPAGGMPMLIVHR